MDIVATFNPPRMVQLAGETFWCRAISYEDFATVMAWIDDVVPGRSDRKTPPAFGSPESIEAIESMPGQCLLTWVALRHSGVTYERACELTVEADPVELARLSSVLFSRRRTRPERQPVEAGEDAGEAWYGPMVHSFVTNCYMTIPDVAAMTIDQLDMLASKGLEQEHPHAVKQEFLMELDRQAKENRARAELAEAERLMAELKNGDVSPVVHQESN